MGPVGAEMEHIKRNKGGKEHESRTKHRYIGRNRDQCENTTPRVNLARRRKSCMGGGRVTHN